MEFHRIRLHGPWQLSWRAVDLSFCQSAELGFVTSDAAGARAISVRLPGEISSPDEYDGLSLGYTESVGAGSVAYEVRLVRRFNRPTGLADNQTVLVGCWSDQHVVSASLNGIPLLRADSFFSEAASDCFSIPVDLLANYNSLHFNFPLGRRQRLRIDQVALGLY